MRYVEKACSSSGRLRLYANGAAVVPIEKEIYEETAGLYEALASKGLGGGAGGQSERAFPGEAPRAGRGRLGERCNCFAGARGWEVEAAAPAEVGAGAGGK